MTTETPCTTETTSQPPLDLDREMDRWFALCKRDKAYRRAFTMLMYNGFGSIKTEMKPGRKLSRVVSEVVFTGED